MPNTFGRAIIVGASSGIGRALALQLGAAHAQVVLVARRADALEQVAEEVRAAGGQATALVHDVSDRAEASAKFDEALAKLGGLDLLVYAAGILERIREG